MNDHVPDELTPAGRDLRAYTDELRPQHPVVRNVLGEWVLLRHDLVTEAALDHDRFSNAVSRHLHVPNGLDGTEHTAMREALDPFLSVEALAPYVADFERIASDLMDSLPRGETLDAVSQIGATFAVRGQSVWLGWPPEFEDRLAAWVAENREATRSSDRSRTRQVAEDFDAIIHAVLASTRLQPAGGGPDVTTQLASTTVDGRPLTEPEIVSILRNWTGGDLGSIALCVGVLVYFLATHPEAQTRLRAGVPDDELDAVIDEILRIDDPFVSNTRVTTCPVQVGGADIPAGARVKLNWTSANRDEGTFVDPDAVDASGNAAKNLVYGLGKHACPGRLLSTIDLRIATRALLASTTSITLAPDAPAEREVAPVGGWRRVPVILC
ncbi:MAG TPA: cytochrome P450 [Propionibacteriaceae bacterium]|nr:cytochrome P450 [Propionibacteriaceae bacterium]